MSSYDSIYKKMASSLEHMGAGKADDSTQKFDVARQILPPVAHELNNILTIIRGYADRLVLKNTGNSALEPHLKLISEAARRGTVIVRNATPSDLMAGPVIQSGRNSQPPQPPAA